MIDLEILKANPELAKSVKFEISGTELITVTDELTRRAIDLEKAKKTPEPEVYLTPEEMARTLRVSQVTLWSWDKKGITHPLRIGNMKRYRRSDVEKFLTQE